MHLFFNLIIYILFGRLVSEMMIKTVYQLIRMSDDRALALDEKKSVGIKMS